MGTATTIQNFSLTMNRQFTVSKKAVYDAWTNEEALKKWFAPTSEMTTVVHVLETHVGGKYRIEMIEPTGTSHKIHGEYVALTPHDQIVFTWEWESDEQKVNSLVTIDLSEKNGTTDMVLTHEKLASQESVDLHSVGWTGCLGQLEIFINK
jgi:uncharacterized protein YndB with AHSA1/START domain